MNKYISRILLFTLLIAFSAPIFSQETNKVVEMADTMRSNGKIFVVVAVIVTLFAGIVFYLVSLDRRISKFEKESGKA